MLLSLFKAYLIWLAISGCVCVLGALGTWLWEPSSIKVFVQSYVYFWNGLLVSAFGFGTLHFAFATYRQKINFLVDGVLDIPANEKPAIYYRVEKLFSIYDKQIIAIPTLITGSALMYICGYPMVGFPHYFLWLTSSLMFYAGGLMLAGGWSSIQLFESLESRTGAIGLQDNVQIYELEDFNLYISVLTLSGIVALYFSFRGTLSANFTFQPPDKISSEIVGLFIDANSNYKSVRNLLLYPIIVFLPAALFCGIYIRFVLRKIYLANIKQKLLEIDALAQELIGENNKAKSAEKIIEIKRTAIELREKIIQNNNPIPLVQIIDSPSIALYIIVILQFAFGTDPIIKPFFDSIVK